MSWKRKFRPAIDQFAKYSGLLWTFERRMRSKITILMYHRVLEDADCHDYPFSSLVMPRSLFEAQLDYLSQNTLVMPVSEALSQVGNRSHGTKPIVCITFDDGYVDNSEIAAPLLEARGLRATFFIAAGGVQEGRPLWYDRAAALWTSLGGAEAVGRIMGAMDAERVHFETPQSWIEWLKTVPNQRRVAIMAAFETEAADELVPCPLMNADQVQQLASRGHEIGSHTLWHPILTTMAEDERQDEINGARQLLRQWTRREVPGFCYPNGNFNEGVIRQLDVAGHTYACTTLPGSNDEGTNRFRLRRIDVKRDQVTTSSGDLDVFGFRAEISLLREGLRRWGRVHADISAHD